jgi:hypothetical protein
MGVTLRRILPTSSRLSDYLKKPLASVSRRAYSSPGRVATIYPFWLRIATGVARRAAPEKENVMVRNLGISLLLFGLFLAGVDGFRVRERVRTAPSSTTMQEPSDVHTAEIVGTQPPR